jgi:hypothetical protein
VEAALTSFGRKQQVLPTPQDAAGKIGHSIPSNSSEIDVTAQIPESLRYNGQQLAMCTNPLNCYFSMAGIFPGFVWCSTALARGYVGTWEISDGRLYLLALRGELQDGSMASLATFFPDFPTRVFAHWYSGTLRVPQGKLLKYVHQGYASISERDLFLDIEKGVLRSTKVRHNGASEDEDGPEGYQVGAMTIFSRNRRQGEQE